jgi:hypothetical protein
VSRATDLADAVAAELNGHVFSQQFTAERSFVPIFKRAETSLYVSVVPGPQTKEIKTHTTTGKTLQIDIGVQGPLSDGDDLSDLLEAIDDFLEFRELEAMTNAAWIGSEMAPGSEAGYVAEHAQEGVFTGVVRATYRIR